jgi:putative ABC transport system substrate-binding protein
VRRIGVLMFYAADDPAGAARIEAFRKGLQQAGWTEGRNIQIDLGWAADDPDAISRHAAEAVALAPDVVVATGGTLDALRRATATVPIVFVLALDPVGTGYVASLARPGGNMTGFASLEFGISGKWLELLKQMAPNVTRVGVIRDATFGGIGQWGALQGAAPLFGVELIPIDGAAVERGIEAFAQRPNGGLVVASSAQASTHRRLIIALAAQYRLPAVYPTRTFVPDGGLISYGPEQIDPFRQAAGYVDRILRGEKPADLPVQAPTKYELVANLKTAKSLGLTVPQSILLRADEVIE